MIPERRSPTTQSWRLEDAYVLQIRGPVREGQIDARIEHVKSGDARLLSSVDQLLAFLDRRQTLDTASPVSGEDA